MPDRDYVYSDEEVEQNTFWPNGLSRTSNTYLSLSDHRFRDQSVATAPVNGVYTAATQYYAFYGSARPSSYDYVNGATGISYRGTGRSDQPFAGNAIYYGTTGVGTNPPSIPIALAERCKGSVLSKIRNNDFDLGQALAELPEAIAFIGDTLYSVAALYRAIKRRDAGRAREVVRRYFGDRADRPTVPRRVHKEAATAYLQYQFAWKPMMNDIYQLLETLSEGLPEAEVCKVKSALQDDTYELPVLSSTYRAKGSVSGKVVRGVEVGVSFKITNPLIFDLSRLGLLNPLAIAWELVPLSFVFDWFIPIGRFLDALTVGLGLSFKTGYQTLFLRNNFTGKYWPGGDVGFPAGKQAEVRYQTKSMKRDLLTTFPVPLPVLDIRLNKGKLLSGLALILAIKG